MATKQIDIAVIGGGAAGFFAAIHAKTNYPHLTVSIFERSKNVLSKVKISGGGRCNVTNATYGIADLAKQYPRGHKALKKVFNQFKVQDTIDWFQKRGVELVTQDDLCIFPVSQSSQTIIDCFLNECKQLGVEILTECAVRNISKTNDLFNLELSDQAMQAKSVILTIGGQAKLSGFGLMDAIPHPLVPPVPSLFTFNMPKEPIIALMGIVVNPVTTRIEGTKLVEEGPLLVTHWGMSGPAVLKLSAWGARILAENKYDFNLLVNWLNDVKYDEAMASLKEGIAMHGQKKVRNQKLFDLPSRLWHFLIEKVGIDLNKKWHDLSKKDLNKLIEVLVNDRYAVKGKTTFKEEFVTAGGIDLTSVDFSTMQSRLIKGLYFAGEALDVDGITGGFNFQAAWSTGFVCGLLKD